MENLPADKNDQGVEVRTTTYIIDLEHWDMGHRRGLPALSESLREVYRHLQETGRMLRPDGPSPETHLHKASARVHNLPHMWGEERSSALQPATCEHVRPPGPALVWLEVRSLDYRDPCTSIFQGVRLDPGWHQVQGPGGEGRRWKEEEKEEEGQKEEEEERGRWWCRAQGET